MSIVNCSSFSTFSFQFSTKKIVNCLKSHQQSKFIQEYKNDAGWCDVSHAEAENAIHWLLKSAVVGKFGFQKSFVYNPAGED